MVDFLEAESTVVSEGPEHAPLFRRILIPILTEPAQLLYESFPMRVLPL